MRLNNRLIFITLTAALGGFLFGFDTAVIAGTTSDLEKLFSLDKFWLGFTVSIALIGTIIGTMAVEDLIPKLLFSKLFIFTFED